MGNEFGTDISTFNIGDYVWYIVGGIALFFVIVGYIADKSGLAKKTFIKDVKKSDKKVKEPIVEEIRGPVVEEVNEDLAIENNNGIFDDNLSFVEMPVVDVSTNEVLVSDDIVGENEPLYISADSEVSTDHSLIDNSEVVLDASDSNELQNDIVVEDNNAIDNVWVEDTVLDDTDSNQDVNFIYEDSKLDDVELGPITEDVVEVNEDISVDVAENENENDNDNDNDTFTTDNAEEEWGIETASQISKSEDLIDVELPNLDDIEVNSEEDVWKF